MSIINLCHDFRYGKIIYNVKDRYIGRSLALYGEYSPGEADFFKQILKPGNTVIEVGANIGSLTVPLAQMVGETGKVIAFEPQRLVFQVLAANVAINSLVNVYTYNKGVSDKAGKITIDDPYEYISEINTGAVELKAKNTGYEVDIVRLDDLNLTSCNMLKIDCEGMEKEVLLGAKELITKHRPIIYIEQNKNHLDILREYNYKIYEHNPPLYSPNNYFGSPVNIFVGSGYTPDGKFESNAIVISFNWFCLPAEFDVEVTGFKEVK